MPFGALLGATAIAGASSLWQYNRENYMFEAPLRQTQIYQYHNIVIARFNLFREDVRDLCALTTSRVQSYLIVNTLKLGFIISVMYNYDRSDSENGPMAFEEEQVNLLFSMLMLTGAFWLLTSIWFSMNGLIVAQSLCTKLLARVVRIPLPSEEEIASAAGDAQAFERHLSDHFRVPMLGRPMEMRGRPPSEESDRAGRHLPDDATATLRSAAGAPADASRRLKGSPMGRARSSPRERHATDEGPNMQTLSILDLLYTEGEPSPDATRAAIELGAEPHIKLFKMLAASWEPYDFYSKVSMHMGTAAMLSGLAYYGLYYMRTSGATFMVETGGWCAFAFMSLLSWWSLILDLNLNRTQHIIVGCLVLSGPSIILFGYNRFRMHWVLPLTISTTTAWIVLMCWSAVSRGTVWPKVWRASLFMNVLHSQERLVEHSEDVVWSSLGRAAPHPTGFSRAGTTSTVASTASFSSSSSYASDDEEEEATVRPHMARKVSKSILFVAPLLASLEYLLDVPSLDKTVSRSLRQQRDYLFEAARANGVANHWRPGRPLSGFWVQLPQSFNTQQTSEWVDPYGVGNPSVSPSVTLAELKKMCRHVGQSLFADAIVWSMRDMRALAEYGGEPVPGVKSFTSQFHRQGTGSSKNLGHSAFSFFTAGTVLVTILWCGALVQSFQMTYFRDDIRDSIDIPPTLRGERMPMLFPFPWADPGGLGCDAKGGSLVLADPAAGAFVFRNVSGGWDGPHAACGSEDLVAADIGPHGVVYLACPSGLQTLAAPGILAGSIRNLTSIALDSMPNNRSFLQGIALRNGNLVGLRLDQSGSWRIAGSINAPLGRKWSSLGLASGRALVLDAVGLLYELDTVSGAWRGPFELPGGIGFRGICALDNGLGFLALAPRGTSLNVQISAPAPPELWRFEVPAPWDPGPIPQAPAFFERIFGKQ